MGIIKDKETFKGISALHADVKFDALKPFLEDAEDKFIVPLLGDTFYETFSELELYNTTQKKLLNPILKAIVPLGQYLGADELNVGWGSNGLIVEGGENSAPASEVRTEKMKRSLLDRGHRALSKLVKFVAKNKGDYEGLDDSEWTNNQPSVFPDVETYQKFCNIENSYFIYLKLVPYIIEQEEETLTDLLGEELYADFIENKSAEKYQAILRPIYELLACFSFVKGIVELRINVDDRGVTIFNNNYAETVNTRQPAPNDIIAKLIADKEKNGTRALGKILQFFQDNVAEHPLFENSDRYVATEEEVTETNFDPLELDGAGGFI